MATAAREGQFSPAARPVRDNDPMAENPIQLTDAEARVLGALMEKEATTPDNYPLSLNALMNACNQRSNREPVMDLDEEGVRQALHGLEELRLAGPARDADGRVAKFEHWLGEAFNLTRAENALLCVLLLRGAQTPGELRGRTERLHRFDEIGDVTAALQRLIDRDAPLAALLPRQPGAREQRYTHLLCGPAELVAAQGTSAAAESAHEDRAQQDRGHENRVHRDGERFGRLEQQVQELQNEIAALRQRIDDLFG